MTHRAYRNHSGEDRLDSVQDFDRTPAAKEHHGPCGSCGADTTRNVTVGAPGHPRNGWECHGCGENYLRQEMAQRDATYTKAVRRFYAETEGTNGEIPSET